MRSPQCEAAHSRQSRTHAAERLRRPYRERRNAGHDVTGPHGFGPYAVLEFHDGERPSRPLKSRQAVTPAGLRTDEPHAGMSNPFAQRHPCASSKPLTRDFTPLSRWMES